MRKTIRIARNIFYVLIGLTVAIVLTLLIFYHWQAKHIHDQEKAIEEQLPLRVIEADSLILNPAGNQLNLLPVPKSYTFGTGVFQMPEELEFLCADTFSSLVSDFATILPNLKQASIPNKAKLTVVYRDGLPEQGYHLVISQEKILIEFSHAAGLNYAFVTLKVLNRNYKGNIPCVTVEDQPDFPVRGVMLDISRDKVPTLQTLHRIVEVLGDLKYNHFELYVEGFSFAYPSFTALWQGKETPVTGNEIKLLDSICKSRFIELVPNQNSFGHMSAWLATEQFSSLAENPDGFKFLGLIDMKSTLDPSDRGSVDLVTRMTDDMLPYFSSQKINVNLDEPFELGMGKSKKRVEREGIGKVYLDYALKIHDMLKARDRRMIMWGDIVLRHPEIIRELPDDIMLLDWGYTSEYPFEKNARMLQSQNLEFMLCPGTSSWLSISGLTDNMKANIASAAVNGLKYNASGLLLTDWGDMGHWQYLPVSYAGYATGASYSWNAKNVYAIPLVEFLNSYFFEDVRGIMGNLVLDLGRYQIYEEVTLPNMTTTMLSLQFGLQDKLIINAVYDKFYGGLMSLVENLSPEMKASFQQRIIKRKAFDYIGFMTFLEEKQSLLMNADLRTPDSNLVRDEYLNAIRLIRTGAILQYYIKNKNTLKRLEKKEMLEEMQLLLQQYLSENHRLWHIRNKSGGYERSTKVLSTLAEQINRQLLDLEKPFISRAFNSIKEKMAAAVAVIYLKTQ